MDKNLNLKKEGQMKKMEMMLSVLMLLLSAHFLSATTISVKGTVKSNAGIGIAGAKVSLAINKSSATTDDQGSFEITRTNILTLQSKAKP